MIIILHVGFINGDMTSGAQVALLNCVNFQKKYSKCALFNVADYDYESLDAVFLFSNYKKIKNLPAPFNKPDIVVFHEIYRPAYISLAEQCKTSGTPYIIIPHGGLSRNAQKIKPFKKFFANLIFFNRFINNSLSIQYLTNHEQENSINQTKGYIISGNSISVKSRINYKRNETFYKILYIGRYDVYFKGLDILLEAINIIKDFMIANHIKLELYGKGEKTNLEFLYDYIKNYKLDEIVTVNGPVFGIEKENKYRASDIFIQTSRSEGQPMGIIEALSYGLPVIVTPGTNFKKIVRENQLGYSCELLPESIAETIVKSFDFKNENIKYSSNSYEFVYKNFDGNKIASETVDKYKRLVMKEEKTC